MRYGGVGMKHIVTMTLGDIIESLSYGIRGTTNDKIRYARPHIFCFEYESWTPEHKERFELLFLKHFYFHEIAFETEGRFLFELELWLQENMSFYIKLLQSQIWEEQIKNPFHNYELTDITNINSDRISSETQKEKDNKDIQEKADGTTNTSKTGNTNKTGTSTSSGTKDVDIEEEESADISSERSGNTSGTDNTTLTGGSGKTKDINVNETTDTDISKTGSGTSSETANNFNRKLEEDTPQSRLAITPQEDGTGVIQYASNIEENKNTGTTSTTTSQTETGSEGVERTGTTLESETGSHNETTTNTTTGTDTETTEQAEIRDKKATQKETNSNETRDTLNEDNRENENSSTNNNQTTNVIGSLERDSDSNEQVKTVENRHAIGSIGVARYDELLNGYRTIFHNYDKQILDAMHSELFMLVY